MPGEEFNDHEQLAQLLVGGGGFEMLCRLAKHLHLTGVAPNKVLYVNTW
jgi:hypothetical protein